MTGADVGGPRPRVALCEPDALLRALLSEWLQRAGFEPVRCADTAMADSVVLIVADVLTPRLDGAACLSGLRQRFPRAKVLAISGHFMAGVHGITTAGIELAADAALAKPFTAQAFDQAVRGLMRGAP